MYYFFRVLASISILFSSTGCVKKNGRISSDLHAATGGCVEWGGRPLGRRENEVSFGNMEWLGTQSAFVVETFLKNRESVIATQRAFRTHFELRRRNRIPTLSHRPVPLPYFCYRTCFFFPVARPAARRSLRLRLTSLFCYLFVGASKPGITYKFLLLVNRDRY
jgi:hypothetical protein